MKPALLVAIITLFIGGCASDDPNQGGFFGGLVGLGSESYEQRITDKTESWNADERRYQREVAGRNELDATVRDRHYQVTDLELQVAEIEGDLATLNSEIEALRAEEVVTSGELSDAESKIASLLDDIDSLSADQAAARVLDAETADNETVPDVNGIREREREAELRAYIAELSETIEALDSARDRNLSE